MIIKKKISLLECNCVVIRRGEDQRQYLTVYVSKNLKKDITREKRLSTECEKAGFVYCYLDCCQEVEYTLEMPLEEVFKFACRRVDK